MYCPSCGAQNNEDVRFCRKCGADLRVVSQAMTKRLSWWKYIATKIDDRAEAQRRKEDYNKGLVEISHAALILMIGIPLAIIYIIDYRDFMPFMLLGPAFSLLGFGLRDYWIYRRRLKHEYHPDPLEVESQLGELSIYKPDRRATDKERMTGTSEVGESALTTSLPAASPPSITEQTTQTLGQGNQRDKP